MSLADGLAGAVRPCAVEEQCLNSPQHRGGEEGAACRLCKYAAENGGSSDKWRPWKSGLIHPQKLLAKREARQATLAKRVEKRKSRDTGKQKQYRSATRAERKTERLLIKSTVNSGRSNQDGDHDMGAGRIALDTKEQTTCLDPVIHQAELDKIRLQARRSGHVIGALLIRNKEGRGFLVMDEADYSVYFSRLIASMVREILE